MLSKEVLTELDVLKNELKNISSSIKYIDRASEVAQKSSEVIDKLSGLSSSIESIQKEHLVNLNNYHKRKVESIQESLKVVITNADSALLENQSALKKYLDELNIFHKKVIESNEKSFKSIIVRVDSKINKIENLIKSTEAVNSSIRNYYNNISEINFPNRLDKIDNQISSISIGTGNLQTTVQRLNDLSIEKFEESNKNIKNSKESILNQVNDSEIKMIESISSTNENLKKEIEIINGNVKTNRIISIVSVILILGLLFLSLLNKLKPLASNTELQDVAMHFNIPHFLFLRKCVAIREQLQFMGFPNSNLQIRNIPVGSENYYACFSESCYAAGYQIQKNERGYVTDVKGA